jgi:hypothetical protein
MSEDQKRAHTRRMLEVPATARLSEAGFEWTIHLIDICRAGMAFASARNLPFGSPIHVTFSFPDASGPCSVHGTVVYCSPLNAGPHFRTGVRLDPMDEHDEQLIVDFVTAPHTGQLAAARAAQMDGGPARVMP